MTYIVGDNAADVLSSLTIIAQKQFACFASNQMKANHDKCYLLLSTKDEANTEITNVKVIAPSQKNYWCNHFQKMKFDQ